MALRVAIQMDPIASIHDPEANSTLLLGIEAQRRGHELYYYTPDKLAYCDGDITASAHRITLHPQPVHYYDLGEMQTLDLKTMDVILLRQDPPFDMAYITTTYLLERLHPKPFVVNNPANVRDCPEKIFPTLLRQFMPPTLITADTTEIKRFRKEHKDIVIKPLYGYGGHSVLRLKPDDGNFNALMDMIFATHKEPWVVQKFLPEVKTSERRITFIDGQPAGIIGLTPMADEIRANFGVGGTAIKAEMTPGQHKICEVLGPLLKEKGLLLAGVDLIGDYLMEINLTSPAAIIATNYKFYGTRIDAQFWDAVERYLP